MKKRILLMYISENSGHHKASLAIQQAITLLDKDVEVLPVNSLSYTNPVMEKIISKTYLSLIRKRPEFWGYLYDNPYIVRKTRRFREFIHRSNSLKLRNLMDSFRPGAVVCTQAFPCGLVSDFKRTHNPRLGLYGVLTDYAPHSYWIYDNVNAYFVPSQETKDKLIHNGIPSDNVIETGIPVDPIFNVQKDSSAICKKFGLDGTKPIVLVMGGSQGFGPIKDVFNSLLKTKSFLQIVVIAGQNRSLYRWISRQQKNAEKNNKSLKSFSFASDIDELMQIATVLISKPGGITSAEALTKGVPLLIINPIPGQEQMNTDYLMKNDVALRIFDPRQVGIILEELLYNNTKLSELNMKSKALSKPHSARDIANFVLGAL